MTHTKKNRAVRFGLVATVAAALTVPLVSQHLRAQDEPAPKPTAGAGAPPAAGARPKAQPLTATPAVDPSTVIASAGDVKVTAGDFESFISQMPPQQQAQIGADPEAKRQMADQLLKLKALAAEAERRKLGEDPKVKTQLEALRSQVLVQALVQSLQGDEAGDKKYFEAHPEQFGRVQARHILVGTRNPDPKSTKPALTDDQAKKKADEIRARLAKGEDFSAMAKAESDDPGVKENGGEYTFGRGEMVPSFEQAAYALKENEISQPVKSQFGYHVIQLMKRLPGTFEEARQTLPRHRLDDMVKQLMGDAEPKFNDSFFAAGTGAGGAEAGPATTPGAQGQPQDQPALRPAGAGKKGQ